MLAAGLVTTLPLGLAWFLNSSAPGHLFSLSGFAVPALVVLFLVGETIVIEYCDELDDRQFARVPMKERQKAHAPAQNA